MYQINIQLMFGLNMYQSTYNWNLDWAPASGKEWSTCCVLEQRWCASLSGSGGMKRSKIENMVEYGGRRIRNIASWSRSGERKRSRIGNINSHCYLSLSWVNLKIAHDEFLNLLSQKYREKKNALETFYQRFGICNMTAKTYCIDNVRFLWKCQLDHCPH